MTDETVLEIDSAAPVEPAKAAQILLYVIAALFFSIFVWAATAKLDRVTRGEGRVVPSSRLQEVQYFEGGIVKEILVRPGDRVLRDDVLVRVDPTQASADYVQGRDSYRALAARIVRLEAESQDRPLHFPEDLAREAPDVIADESALYRARRAEFSTAQEVAAAKLDDARTALAFAEEAFAFADEEFAIVEPLVRKGVEPQLELVRARQRRAAAQGELQRARIAARRAESELVAVEQTYRTQAADELTRVKAQLAEFTGGLPALRDKFERTELRAPIDGVVNRVLVSTIGGVVKPGDTVVEIVPAGDTPVIKARIKPADIGFLHPGQKARVKLTAYDSSVYGSLDARIETIGADAVEDEKTGESYFEISVRTEDAFLRTRQGPLPLTPGMSAEVDVLNGKRTVLAYLFKPLVEVKSRALTEQ